MANQTDLDALVVRLVGEASEYDKIMDKAESDLREVSASLEQAAQEATEQQNQYLAQAARVIAAVATPLERYEQEMAQLNDLLKQGYISQDTFNRAMNQAKSALPETQAAQESQTEALRQHNATLQRAEQIMRSVMAPAEKYEQELRELNDLLREGHISQETYNRATSHLNDTLPATAALQDQLNKELAEAEQLTRSVATPAENYQRELGRLNQMLRNGHISQETYNRGLQHARQSLPQVQQAQEAHNQALQRAKMVAQSVLSPLEKYEAELQELDGLLKKGYISQEQFNKAVKSLGAGKSDAFENMARNAHQTVTQLAGNLQTLGMTMTATLTAPIVAAVGTSAHAFASYQDGMLAIKSVVRPTAAEMGQLNDAAMGLSRSLGVDPTAIVGGFTELLKAGRSVQDILQGAGRDVTEFAKVGELALDRAAIVVSDTMKLFGDTSTDTVNTLAAAADASSVGVSDITEAFSQAAAVAAANNVSLKETAALIGLLGANAIKGSDGGTSLRTMLMRLSSPTEEVRKEFSALYKDLRDSSGEMIPVADRIAVLQKHLGGLSGEARDKALTDIFGSDAIRAALVVLKEGSAGFEKFMGDMDNAATVTEKYKEQTSGLSGAWANLTAAIARFNIALGGSSEGMLADITNWLVGIVDMVTEWVNENQGLVKQLLMVAGVIATLGPFVTLIASVVAGFGALVGFVAGFVTVGASAIATGAAIAAMVMGIVGWIAVLGAAVVGLIYYVVGPDSLASAWTYVSETAKKFFMAAAGFLMNFKTNIQVLLDWLPRNWQAMFADMIDVVFTFGTNMLRNMTIINGAMGRLFTVFAGWLGAKMSHLFTVEIPKFAVAMSIKLIQIFQRMAVTAAQMMMAILTGQSFNTSAFFKQLKSDFTAGATSTNLGESLNKVLEEEMGGLVNPLAGFKSSISEAPKFVYDMGLKTGQALSQGIKDGTEPVNQATGAGGGVAAIAEMTEMQKVIAKTTFEFEKQQASVTRNARQLEIWELQKKGATNAEVAHLRALDASTTKIEDEKKALEKLTEEAKKILSPQEKFVQEQKQLVAMLDKGLISLDAFQHQMKGVKKELEEELKVSFKITGVEAVEAGSAEALARFEEFQILAQAQRTVQIRTPQELEQARVLAAHSDLDAGRPMAPVVAEQPKPYNMFEDKALMERNVKLLEAIAENTNPAKQVAVKVEPANLGSTS